MSLNNPIDEDKSILWPGIKFLLGFFITLIYYSYKMKVTFIYPNLWANIKSTDALQPLAMAALAANTPPHWDIRFFDERIETIDLQESTDLVALSVMTFTAKRAYAIAAHYRRQGIPVVMGGFHATIMTEEVGQHADAVVAGDLENVWSQILLDVKHNRLKPLYSSGVVHDPGGIRFDRSIFRKKRYAPMVPVQFSRGCRYACDFCSIHSFYGPAVVSRPMKSVLREIAQIPQKFLIFVDDNLFVNEQTILPFLRELKRLHKLWTCQISIDAAYNDGLLKELKDSGCSAVLVGFESMDQDNLKAMSKGGNLAHKDYVQAVQRFRDAGLMVCGAFVFGYDHDTEDTLWRTLEFALKEKLALCHFNLLFPYPKTRVYSRLEEQGRLFYDQWWLHDKYRFGEPLFHPAGIDGYKLADLCFQARKEFNRYRNIISRSWDFKANARSPLQYFSFLLSNLISRREILRKQGRALG